MTPSLWPWRVSDLGRLSKRTPYNIVLLTGLFGYPIVAGIVTPLGLNNTAVSAALRTVTVGAAIVSIALSSFSSRARESNYLLVALYAFWILYILRILEATLLSEIELSHSIYFYLIWAVGGSALPMFALALLPTAPHDIDDMFPWIYFLLLASSILIALGGSTYAGRLHLANLNPISTGHVGASICLLSMWALLFGYAKDGPSTVFFGGAILGLFLLVASNSRGPILAFFVALCLFIVAYGRRRVVVAVSIAGAMLLIFICLALLLETQFKISTFSRFFDTQFFQEVSVALRWKLYVGAVEAFLRSPLFGAVLEVPEYKAYPHNIFIEAFMATGVIGGAILLSVVASVLVRGFRATYHTPQQSWIFVLFVQYLIGAQFSGSLYTSTHFWMLLGIMVSTEGWRSQIKIAGETPLPRRPPE